VGRPGPKTKNVNEELIVKRYTVARWPITRCAKEQRISAERAKDILVKHGVPLRGKAEVEPAEIIAAYQRHRSVPYVAKTRDAPMYQVERILDENGIERPSHGPRPTIPGHKNRETPGKANP
jgi:hypothetical protein